MKMDPDLHSRLHRREGKQYTRRNTYSQMGSATAGKDKEAVELRGWCGEGLVGPMGGRWLLVAMTSCKEARYGDVDDFEHRVHA